jgi:hypothetical protein
MCGPGLEISMLLYEDCVLCGIETEYMIDDNIDERECYVEGSGQLCKKCWKDTYKK